MPHNDALAGQWFTPTMYKMVKYKNEKVLLLSISSKLSAHVFSPIDMPVNGINKV